MPKFVQMLRPVFRPLRGYYAPFAMAAIFNSSYRRRVVTRETDFVIEGSPRSANGFLQHYIELNNQDRALRIAHHTHAPGQLRGAYNLGIPIIVIVRDPLGSVTSMLLRAPHFPPDQVILDYIQFQSYVKHLSNHIFVTRFDTIIKNPEAAVRPFSERFSLNLLAPPLTPEMRQQIFDLLDRNSSLLRQGNRLAVSRPAAAKSIEKQRIETQLTEERKLAVLMQGATELFNSILPSAT